MTADAARFTYDFEDPYSDITSEETSRLIILLQKDKPELTRRHEVTARKLDELIRSQSETNSNPRLLQKC